MYLPSAELAQRVKKVQLDNELLTYCILLAIYVDSDQTAEMPVYLGLSWSQIP